MGKKYRAAIFAIVGALALSPNVQASGLDKEPILDSYVTDEEYSEATKLFDWKFDSFDTKDASNVHDEVAPLGVYFAVGHASIKKKSSISVYIYASTDCYKICDKVKVVANLQRLVNGNWTFVTDRKKTLAGVATATTDGTVTVKSGYYYRVVGTHTAVKGSTTEYGSTTTGGILVK